MPDDADDRTGTVRFILCDYAVRAGDENINYYCCSQSEVMRSGKYLLATIGDGDNYIKAAQLGGVLLDDEELLEFSWARQKKKEERAERVLKPCIECKFWKIKKEDLSKKLA